MSFTVIIPARFASSRLPGKPLADIAGNPMIQHVFEKAQQSGASRVIIATDNEQVEKAAKTFGAEVCMTSEAHNSGTERLAEVVSKLGIADDEIIVNIQGDEPLIPPVIVSQVAENLAKFNVNMATLAVKIHEAEELFNPNAVKVITDKDGYVLYFSRSVIPYDRDQFMQLADTSKAQLADAYLRHIGIYAYRAGFIKQYVQWAPTQLENLEKLEQLRVLWYGERIHVELAKEVPAVGVDSPSIAPLKEGDKNISLTLPAGDWEAIAVTFPGIKDPLVLRKIDDNHLVTTGDQTVLSIQDNQIQIPIPDETNRKVGNAIEAYSIQGNTTSSPVVAVFTKKDENQQPTTSKGDDPAPIVEIPEYTKPISTAGQEQPPTVSIPEYTKPIGTAGLEQPPTVSIPEYTKPIGTAGLEQASTVSVPEYKLRVLKDERTGVEIIGGATDLEGISHISSRRVLAQELFGKIYDAYDIQFKNPNNHNIQPQRAVLVRLPITTDVENVYYLSPTKELEALDFTVREGRAEFTTSHFGTLGVVYQSSHSQETTPNKTIEIPSEPTSLNFEQTSTTDSPTQMENTHYKEQLPETGESSNPLLFLAGLSVVLTSIFLLKNKID